MGRKFGAREGPARCEESITWNRQLGRSWLWWKDKFKVKTSRCTDVRAGLKWVTISSVQGFCNYGQWNFLQSSNKNGRVLDQSRDFNISRQFCCKRVAGQLKECKNYVRKSVTYVFPWLSSWSRVIIIFKQAFKFVTICHFTNTSLLLQLLNTVNLINTKCRL